MSNINSDQAGSATLIESGLPPPEKGPQFEFTFKAPSYAAQSYKVAARINADSTSPEEFQSLLDERKKLLHIKMRRPLTKPEANRLAYVRWSLDRVEDARNGGAIDALEDAVGRYKAALRDIQSLNTHLQGHLPKRK